jgi:amino acid transporter
VSGGAYGIEDAVRIAGPRLTLILCAIIPITLSLPTALMAAELTSLMPVEGGFYFWVKEGLGGFAGFAEAYLTLLFTLTDTALYPVLFSTYASFLVPLSNTGQIILAIGLIWIAGLLNLRGIRLVGTSSIVLMLALLAPFAILIALGSARLLHWQPPLEPVMRSHFLAALGGGLTVIMWNFGGWENVSTIAAEINSAGRNYLRAIGVVLPLVALGYLLPLMVALSGSRSTIQWRTGAFAEIGAELAGPWLAVLIGIGGAVSAFAMFSAAILWVSRLPYVLAREKYLPPSLAKMWEARAVPAHSIVMCCVIFSILAPLGFMTLIVLDVFFYMLALTLEMGALIRLRRLLPNRFGCFMIGGGRAGLYAVASAPILTWSVTFGFGLSGSAGHLDIIIAIALAALTWPIYSVLRLMYGGPQ